MSRMLVLGRDGLGSSDESEYEGWLNWVCAHIDGACGFEVDVDRSSPRDVQDDKVLGCTDDELAVVKEAIQTMWDDYCSEGAP